MKPDWNGILEALRMIGYDGVRPDGPTLKVTLSDLHGGDNSDKEVAISELQMRGFVEIDSSGLVTLTDEGLALHDQ